MIKICVIIPTLNNSYAAAKSLEGEGVEIVTVYDQVNLSATLSDAEIMKDDIFLPGPDGNTQKSLHVPPANVLPSYYNKVLKYCRDAHYYMAAADDMIMHTPNWFDAVKKALPDPYAPRLGQITDGSEGHRGGLAAYPILTKGWVRATGRIFPEIFPYWFTDTWLTDIADALGYKVPIKLDYRDKDGVRGRTNRMRDLQFWSTIYADTYEDRLQEMRDICDFEGVVCEGENKLVMRRPMRTMHAMSLELDYSKWAIEDEPYAKSVRDALELLK